MRDGVEQKRAAEPTPSSQVPVPFLAAYHQLFDGSDLWAAADAKMLAGRIRGHWSIENQVHHCLDVSLAEDRRRIRDQNGAQNFALITRDALSMLKREPTKMSVAMKRRKAAWGDTYLLDVIASGFPQDHRSRTRSSAGAGGQFRHHGSCHRSTRDRPS